MTIIDSLNKRINFLNLLADELELSGVTSIMDVQRILDKTRPSVLSSIL